MPQTQSRDRRRNLIRRKAELRKQLIDVESELEVCELDYRQELLVASASPPRASTTEIDSFIASHRGSLSPDELQFLAEPERGTTDVARFLDISERTIRRRCDEGFYRFDETDAGHRRISTVSVMETLLNGGPEADEGRRLGD